MLAEGSLPYMQRPIKKKCFYIIIIRLKIITSINKHIYVILKDVIYHSPLNMEECQNIFFVCPYNDNHAKLEI